MLAYPELTSLLGTNLCFAPVFVPNVKILPNRGLS